MDKFVYEYFFINEPNRLYGFTFSKKMAERFEENRNMEVLIKRKKSISGLYSEELYSEMNRYQELIDYTVYNKRNEPLEIICPLHEMMYCDTLINQWKSKFETIIESVLSDYSKYLDTDIIIDLMNLSSQFSNEYGESVLHFNTLKMFEKLF